MYRQFFEFPELNNHFYPGLHVDRRWRSAWSVPCWAACTGRGPCCGCSRPRRCGPSRPSRAGPILLERIGWLWSRLSSGWRMVLRERDPQPRADRRRHVRRRDGGQRAGQRLHDGRGHLLPGRLPVQVDPPQRHRPDVQGRARAKTPCWRRPRLPGVDRAEPHAERRLHVRQRPVPAARAASRAWRPTPR